MTKKMLIDAAHPEEVRVAVLENGKVEDFDFESEARKPLRGNIYLARVTRVEPSLQAAFVEYGGNRHGFLAFSEIHPDYYQIPISDRRALQQAEADVVELAAKLELSQRGDDDHHDDDDHDERDPGAIEDDDDQDNPRVKSAADGHEDDDDDSNDPVDEIADPSAEEEEEEEDNGETQDAPVKSKSAEDSEQKTDSEPETQESAAADDNEAENAEQPGPTDETSDNNDAHANDDGDISASDASQDHEHDDDDVSDDDDHDADRERQAAKGGPSRQALFEQYKEAKRKRANLLRNYKIQEVIKRRQILLVQVVKEERGNKGAALTTYMSLAGRYCVLMPNTARGGGISRKIPHSTDRRRLRRVVDSLDVPQGMGLIIRTAGAKRTKVEVKRDYDYLLRLWENIRTLTLKSIAPCLIYEEASLIKRAIRDLYDKDIAEVLVEGETGYREAKDFMKMLMPSHAKFVQPDKGPAPIFLKHGVETQLDGMYLPSVRLKSGGYIVIHQTEALIAIDVNSGRATRERNIEQTALKTNMEAAYEAARQFRLRDLAGLIVLDFIDMDEQKNNRKVEKAMKDAIKNDRARIQIGRISNFGLMEMSRQRRRSGIVDGTTQVCPTCSGAGAIRSAEMAALRILRAVEAEAISGKAGVLSTHASLEVTVYVLNHHRSWLKRIEDQHGVTIHLIPDTERTGDDFSIDKSGVPRERSELPQVIQADQTEMLEAAEEVAETKAPDSDETEERDGERKKRRRRRRRKDAPREGAAENADTEQTEEDSSDEKADRAPETKARDGEEDGEDGDQAKRRRRRGRRGGRRNRRNRGEGENEENADASTEASEGQNSVEQSADNNQADDAPVKRAKAPAQTRNEPAAVEDNVETPPAHTNGAHAPEPAELALETAAADTPTEPPAPSAVNEPPASAASPDAPKKKGWWRRGSDT